MRDARPAPRTSVLTSAAHAEAPKKRIEEHFSEL
jgi:hypothetical protein